MYGCLSRASNWGPAWSMAQACALTGKQTRDLLVCRLALDPLSHTSQGSTVDIKREQKKNQKGITKAKGQVFEKVNKIVPMFL